MISKNSHENFKTQCCVDGFAKVDMRVAKVLQCEKVAGSTKLLKFQLDLGHGVQKTVFSGIASNYSKPEALIGWMVIVVVNFAPRQMAKFGVSEGMILSATGKDNHQLFLLDVDSGAQAGMSVG